MLELGSAVNEGVELEIIPLIIGFAVAAVVGLLSIALVKLVIKHDKFKIFGVYTLILGILCIAYGIFEHVTDIHFYIV